MLLTDLRRFLCLLLKQGNLLIKLQLRCWWQYLNKYRTISARLSYFRSSLFSIGSLAVNHKRMRSIISTDHSFRGVNLLRLICRYQWIFSIFPYLEWIPHTLVGFSSNISELFWANNLAINRWLIIWETFALKISFVVLSFRCFSTCWVHLITIIFLAVRSFVS